MATRKSQRIIIWVIAIVMTVGTLGAYFVVILANNSAQKETEKIQQQQQDARKQQQQANKPLDGYQATPFDKASITELKVETLTEGTGPAATAESTVTANYFGWLSDGTIFDSSNKNGTATPIEFGLGQVISGWKEGLTGVKEGSTVKLSIPSNKAYGSQGAGGVIGPNEPLMFIVELVKVK
jgi:FKBP-type peptidyl-prolyl cis-trans isomerase